MRKRIRTKCARHCGLGALQGQMAVDDFRSYGVVREPASDAEHGVVNVLHDANNLRLAAQDYVMFGGHTRLLNWNQKLAFQSFEGRKAAVGHTEESLTADIFRDRFRPGSLSGTVETQRIRQPQARTPAAIRRVIG